MRRSGQTLLETIIAIAVITISTLATTTLIITTISSGRVSQARIEGANLAREGIEIVRGVRDSNWLKADQNVIDGSSGTVVTWDDSGLTTDGHVPLSGNYIANFNPTTNGWSLCSTVTCSDTKIYCVSPTGTTCKTTPGTTSYETQLLATGCPAGSVCTATNYQRTITIALNPVADTVNFGSGIGSVSIDYLLVKSLVTGSGLAKTFEADERLYNWK